MFMVFSQKTGDELCDLMCRQVFFYIYGPNMDLFKKKKIPV